MTTMTLWNLLLLLVCGLVLISSVSCDDENPGDYGSRNEISDEEQEAMEKLLEQMYNNDVLDEDDEEEFGKCLTRSILVPLAFRPFWMLLKFKIGRKMINILQQEFGIGTFLQFWAISF